MKRIFFLMTLLAMMYGLTLPAYATLIDRGGGFIFDTDLNITWMQDANYAATSEFVPPGGGGALPGQMNWNAANNWAQTLNYGGVSEWRLPDETRAVGGYQGEMAHLFFATLENSPYGTFNSGPFINIQPGTVLGVKDEYWYATELVPGIPWKFSFLSGENGQNFETDDFVYAWAVHDGDIAAVPEPNSLLLLGSGLIGMVAFRKKFKK
jgi:hypothetical protein